MRIHTWRTKLDSLIAFKEWVGWNTSLEQRYTLLEHCPVCFLQSLHRQGCLSHCLSVLSAPTTTISPKRQAEHAHRLKVPLLVYTPWRVHAMPCITHDSPSRAIEISPSYSTGTVASRVIIYICEITRNKIKNEKRNKKAQKNKNKNKKI